MAALEFIIELHNDGKAISVFVLGPDEAWCLAHTEPEDIEGATAWFTPAGRLAVLRAPDWRAATCLETMPSVREQLLVWPGLRPGICRTPVTDDDEMPSRAFDLIRRRRGLA